MRSPAAHQNIVLQEYTGFCRVEEHSISSLVFQKSFNASYFYSCPDRVMALGTYHHCEESAFYVSVFYVLQILNLTQALKDDKSPVQLVQMPVVTVERNRSNSGRLRTESDQYTQSFSHRTPFFSWC